jgi:uncharacterized repeat protein (TIGR01451 family)
MKKFLLFAIFAISSVINAQSTIQSVSPNVGNLGQSLTVTITGQDIDFTTISATTQVSFYNSSAEEIVVNSIEALSESELIANITIPNTISTGLYNLSVETFFWGSAVLPNAFNVATDYNTITGNVSIDINGNGCDASDAHIGGIKVKINNGTSDSYTFTNNAGDYIYNVPAGNFVVTPLPEMPYYSISPPSAAINFATQNNLTETRNFCLGPNGVHNNLNITMLPLSPARPGFDAFYRIVYKNIGNQTMTGTINLVFDDAHLDFVSATPVTTSQTLNNLSWAYVNLLPFESRTIDFTLNANSPMETPALNIGNALAFTATANPVSGDETPDDNTLNFNQIVTGSWDPNDKAVAEGSQINISNVGDYLNYIIRFQNKGTFAAENVVVKDVLASNLDKSTLQVVSSSHPYRSTLTAGNQLEFFFDNINLPAEINNEPGSHGFIAFKIKPAGSVVIGSTIENTAEIYFDFNFPVVTNTVTTTFSVLATTPFDFDDSIQFYPNPVNGIGYIKASEVISNIRVMGISGQVLFETQPNAADCQLDFSAFPKGVYFITAESGEKIKHLKIVRE